MQNSGRACRGNAVGCLKSYISKFGVVPAQAGTHTHRSQLSSRAEAASLTNHAHSWLWAPAFAGATPWGALPPPFGPGSGP